MHLLKDLISTSVLLVILVAMLGFPFFIILVCQKMASWATTIPKDKTRQGFDVLPTKQLPPLDRE